MPLPILDFKTIVNQQATAMNANSPVVLNFDPGSVLLAMIQSNAGNALWLQAIATTLLATTRLSTSSGIDVDTFIADFGYSRQAGTVSSGALTFSRFTPTNQGFVPVGAIVSVPSNNLQFQVVADDSNFYFNPSMNGYVLDISYVDMIIPAVCTITGTIGNVVANTITSINNTSVTTGIDSVTNASDFAGGTDTASDTATKAGFLLYIQSLSRATYQAIQFAVISARNGTEQVTRYNIVENYQQGTTNSVPQLGYFYVVIDNGTGSTCSNGLLDAVTTSVEAYRGLTIQYNIVKALFTAIAITVHISLISNPTETNVQIEANIVSALSAYSDSIPFNQPFLYSKIAQIVYEADSNFASVLSGSNHPTLNTGVVDVAGDNLHVFGTLTSGNVTITIV